MKIKKQIKMIQRDVIQKDQEIQELKLQIDSIISAQQQPPETPGDNRLKKELNTLIDKVMGWFLSLSIGPKFFVVIMFVFFTITFIRGVLGLSNDALDFYKNVKDITAVEKTYHDGYLDGQVSRKDDYSKGYQDAINYCNNQMKNIIKENVELTIENKKLNEQSNKSEQEPNSVGINENSK